MSSENRELGFKVIFAGSDYDSFIGRVDYEDIDSVIDGSNVDSVIEDVKELIVDNSEPLGSEISNTIENSGGLFELL